MPQSFEVFRGQSIIASAAATYQETAVVVPNRWYNASRDAPVYLTGANCSVANDTCGQNIMA